MKGKNETYGVDLPEDDKVDIDRIGTTLGEDEGLKEVVSGNNTLENVRYKFDKVVDDLLLDFVHTKLDLYKKLTDPKVNALFKSKWFEGYHQQYVSQRNL